MKKILAFLVTVSFLIACNSGAEKAKLDSLYAELIEGHDVVMPLSMLQPKLKVKVSELVNEISEGDSLKNTALEINTALTSTNEAMYKWMDDFGIAMNDVKDPKKKIELYEGLLSEIAVIDEETKESIETAKKFIADNE